MKRRKFISQISVGATAAIIPSTTLSFIPSISNEEKAKKINFGIVTDVHKDLMPNANQRL